MRRQRRRPARPPRRHRQLLRLRRARLLRLHRAGPGRGARRRLLQASFAVLLAWPMLLAAGAARADPPPGHFDATLAADVFAAALAFMEPRTLDPVAAPQLVLWGLRGLTTLDPALTTEVRDGALQLTLTEPGGGERVLAIRPLPEVDDLQGWANTSALLCQAGWAASGAVRRAGTTGILHSYFDELFNHLDPYSRYVPPEEAALDREQRIGTAGPGLQLANSEGAVLIQAVAPDGPAADAGIRLGDRLLAVDGRSTQRHRAEEVATWLIGAENVPVALSVVSRRGPVREVKVTRVPMPANTVFTELRAGVLVLRITGFSSDTGQLLASALLLALQGGSDPARVHGVVFDLRGNRGGLLREASTVTGTVLSTGVVASTAGRDPDADHVLRVDGHDLTDGLPLVVLVDGRSASAAEIVAAALADQRRAVVIGSSTLGKGLVQTIARLPDQGELFITWSRVLAPQGWPLQGLGVLPQLCTSLGHGFMEQQQGALLQGRNLLAPALAQARTARAPVALSRILAIRSACPAAEGRDADDAAARFLIDTPAAYRAALLQVGAPD